MSDCGGDPNCQEPGCVAAREANARRAHVKPKHIVGIFQAGSGPFKGRLYEKHADGTLGRRLSRAEAEALIRENVGLVGG